MSAVELGAAIFAIRSNIGYARRRRYDCRLKSAETKNELLIDNYSFEQLKIKSHRLIHSLERHLKRANTALSKSVTRDEFAALIGRWKAHLRWMRLHIVYFKPLRPIIGKRRIRQQQDLDELMKMAERGIHNAGYRSPEPRELRRMMRLFARSTRRWREGENTVLYMLENKRDLTAKWYLAQFVLHRLTLEELKKP